MNFSKKLLINFNVIYYLIHLHYIESLNFHEESNKNYLYNFYKYRYEDEKATENQLEFTNKIKKLFQHKSTETFCQILFTLRSDFNFTNNLSDLDKIVNSFLYKIKLNINDYNYKNYNEYNFSHIKKDLLQTISHNNLYRKIFIYSPTFDKTLKSKLLLTNKVLKPNKNNKNKNGKRKTKKKDMKRNKRKENKGRNEETNNRKKEIKKKFIKLSRNDKLRNFLLELSDFDQFSGKEFIELSPKEVWQFCQFFT